MAGLGWAEDCISNTKLMKIMTGLTKEVVKNNLPQVGTLIRRWMMFGCEPVISLLQS